MDYGLGLKLVLTPVLIGGASLAGRRWGETLGGWLVGLPFTSGPVVLFLALEYGTHFAAAAATGVLVGTVSQTVCAVVFVPAARRGWGWGVAAGSLAFGIGTAVFAQLAISPVLGLIMVLAALLAAVALVRAPDLVAPKARPPAWDLPARMVVTTALVLALTGAAGALGPRLSGLLAPYPLYATVLAVFAQRAAGPAASAQVMRGLVFGLFGFTGFFFVLALALVPLGLGIAFAMAIAVAITSQAITLALLRRR